MDIESAQRLWLALGLLIIGLLMLIYTQFIINKAPCGQNLNEEAKKKYCELLGISTTATIGEVRKAFKEKSEISNPCNKQTGNKEQFDQLKLAYEKLALGLGNVRERK